MSDAEDALKEVAALIEAEYARILNEEASIYSNESAAQKLDEQIASLRVQISELQTKRREFLDSNYEVRRRIGASRREIAAAEDRQRMIEESVEREASLKNRLSHLEEIAAQFPWAERVKRHQREGAFMLADAQRGILADVPGLGKTLQSLAWADLCGAKKILVLLPGEVARNFVNEAGNWAPHRLPFNMANDKKKRQLFMLETLRNFSEAYVILNYEALTNGKKSDLVKIVRAIKAAKFDTVICDEAHRMKNSSTDTYLRVKDIILSENQNAPRDDGTVGPPESSIKNTLMMTGTPILNTPTELYPLLYMTAPHIFYSEATFKQEFCNYVEVAGGSGDGRKQWVLKPGGQASLQRKLAGFYLRRTYESAGIEIPDQGEIMHDIVLRQDEYPKQYAIIKMLREQAAMEIEQGRVKNIQNLLALLTRERQAAAWPGGIQIKEPVFDSDGMPVMEFDDNLNLIQSFKLVNVGALYQESVKIDKAVEIAMESLDNGQRVVVFTKFKTAAKQVVKQMKELGISAIEYSGDTDRSTRDEIKEDFDRETAPEFGEHKWDVCVCQYNAAGVGLNLNAATCAIILDMEFNSGMRDQAYARISRIGQTQPTLVHVLEIRGSADQYMRRLIERKEKLVNGFNATMDQQDNEFLAFFRNEIAGDEDGNDDDDEEE